MSHHFTHWIFLQASWKDIGKWQWWGPEVLPAWQQTTTGLSSSQRAEPAEHRKAARVKRAPGTEVLKLVSKTEAFISQMSCQEIHAVHNTRRCPRSLHCSQSEDLHYKSRRPSFPSFPTTTGSSIILLIPLFRMWETQQCYFSYWMVKVSAWSSAYFPKTRSPTAPRPYSSPNWLHSFELSKLWLWNAALLKGGRKGGTLLCLLQRR